MSTPQELAQITISDLEQYAVFSRNEAIRNAQRMGHNTVAEDSAIANIVQAHVQVLGMIRREQWETGRRANLNQAESAAKVTVEHAGLPQAQVNPDVHSV